MRVKDFIVKVYSGGVLKICSKLTGEHPWRRAICNFIEITLRYGCSPVNLVHIFKKPFYKKTSKWQLLPLPVICIGLYFH